MTKNRKILSLFFIVFIHAFHGSCNSTQRADTVQINDTVQKIIPGAEQFSAYLPVLKGKRIAIVANQTSVVYNTHLVDTLISLGVRIKCVFAPEHGFRGESGAGEKISSSKDEKSGLPIVSLYGKHLKPGTEDLKETDIVIFDIQDVGVRFYTYISTLQYVMEACAENSKLLIILDRPNPNGNYVDGPVLEKAYKSFVGMSSIPVVHGMTVGEYALMLKGERWINNADSLKLKVIANANYTHKNLYTLPVRPSPNLPNMRAVYLYPSLCLFEGTHVSIGRGTEFPFQCYGFPDMKSAYFSFTPKSIQGVAVSPPYKDTLCGAIDLRKTGEIESLQRKFSLEYLISAYSAFPDKKDFFNPFFEKLAGTALLRKQIEQGISEEEIRASWQQKLQEFKIIRKKYLLYPDFEE